VQHLSRHLFFVVIILASSAAQAQWTGKAELGLLYSDGNSKAKSGNAKFDATKESTKWRNNFYAAALYGENGEFVNAERYEARYQVDYKITDRFSWFVGLRGEEDRFSGFAYQATISTGATYKFVDSASTRLDASLGAGYRQLQPQLLIKTDAGQVLERIKGDEENDPVATLGSNFEHSFNKSTKITNKFLSELGSENTSVADDLALQVNMNEVLALAVGIGVRYNTDPPPLAEGTDTLFTVNLVYNIK